MITDFGSSMQEAVFETIRRKNEKLALVIVTAFSEHFGEAPAPNIPIKRERIENAEGCVETWAYSFRGETFLFENVGPMEITKKPETGDYIVSQKTNFQKV